MFKIFIFPIAPPLNQINQLLAKTGQKRLDFNSQGTDTARWLKYLNNPIAEDYVVFYLFAIGLSNLIDMTGIMLNRVGVDVGNSIRMYAITLSELKQRAEQFRDVEEYKMITEQVLNQLEIY